MPFANSFVVRDDDAFTDCRTCFRGLADEVVRKPLSTFILRVKSPEGRTRFLIVDKNRVPSDGERILQSTSNGFRETFFAPGIRQADVWGCVVWRLEEG